MGVKLIGCAGIVSGSQKLFRSRVCVLEGGADKIFLNGLVVGLVLVSAYLRKVYEK